MVAAAVVLLVVSVVFLAAVVVTRGGDAEPAAGDAMDVAPTGPTAPGDPASPTTGPDGRVATAPPEPPADPRHEFLATADDGSPVAWSPCEPVRYVVDPRTESAVGQVALDAALAMVEAATGLDFVFEGEVDEPPPLATGRSRRDVARYGDDWSPVLISWSDPQEEPDLEGALGIALPLPVTDPAGDVYVSGWLVLDGTAMSAMAQAPLAGTIAHELAHLVGLGHVDDPSQLMFDTATDVHDFGAGDLSGLFAVGTGPCLDPTPT